MFVNSLFIFLRVLVCWVITSIVNGFIGVIHYEYFNDSNNIRTGVKRSYSLIELIKVLAIPEAFICLVYVLIFYLIYKKEAKTRQKMLTVFLISFIIIVVIMSNTWWRPEAVHLFWISIFCLVCSFIPLLDEIMIKKLRLRRMR